jgi:thioredoxin reductase (NADPH)
MANSSENNISAPLVKVIGRPGSAEAYTIRDFLHRSDIPYEWIECKSNEEAKKLAGVDGLFDRNLPVCLFPDGTRQENPNIKQIIEKLGWFRNPSRSEYDLAIYGAGPAGLSAAVYGASEGLKTILVEQYAIGGQTGSTSKIENYLGFPKGISGSELAKRAWEQADRFGAEIILARQGVRAELTPAKGVGYLDDGTKIIARTSICATGVQYRRLGLPNENQFLGKGLYYGAGASEAPYTKGKHVFIVGGGNSAGQASMHFAPYADLVTIVIRNKSLKETLSQYLVERIHNTKNIEVLTETEVTALHGNEYLEEITVINRKTGEERKEKTHSVFACIGGEPHTQWAVEVGIIRDEAGYLVTGPDLLQQGKPPEKWPLDRTPYYLETNIPGVFAAGDVRHNSIKRCASAVGEGAMSVAFVHRYLSEG